jgi:hypothetical protein
MNKLERAASCSIVDPHHCDVAPDADPDSTYHSDADLDAAFFI